MTKLILVRHGETEWNDSARFQGQTDIPLNARGRAQAAQVAQRLLRETIAAIYSSDLSRALDTAREIAREHNLAVNVSEQLREASFGSWEGLSFDEVRVKFPQEAEGWIHDPVMIRPHDGETREAIVSRVRSALHRLADCHRLRRRHDEEPDVVPPQRSAHGDGSLSKPAEELVQVGDECRHVLEEAGPREPGKRAQDEPRPAPE